MASFALHFARVRLTKIGKGMGMFGILKGTSIFERSRSSVAVSAA